MTKLMELKEFLIKANRPHAMGTANVARQKDGSHTIIFREGDLSMHDNFFGGEPYGGLQVIHCKSEPIWLCVYYGRLEHDYLGVDKVYCFLREALQHPMKDRPFRGPKSYTKANMEYRNEVRGDMENFSGREVILDNGKQIYEANYLGGLVDQRFRGSY